MVLGLRVYEVVVTIVYTALQILFQKEEDEDDVVAADKLLY